MLNLEELVSNIESLSEEEFSRLRKWFYDRDLERWDREIEKDSKSGKLDFLIREAMREKLEGKLREI